jgi:hypothetical protein
VPELGAVPGKVDEGSGAVVVSGAIDAGGGSEASVSAAGSGASLFAAPGFADSPLAVCVPWVVPFFLPATAGGIAG